MSDLARHIDTLSRANVLCLGDVMLDRFVYGSVDRVSPEAPIPVLRVDRDVPKLGGAGNVAANLVALEAACRFVSVVGRDGIGTDLLALLRREGVSDGAIVVEDGRQTTVKTRFIAGQQQLLRTDIETVVPITVRSRLVTTASPSR